jgi:phi13 family phage major tail protein
MATIGLDKLYYATITDDENGEEIYGTPTQLAKAISAELSVELAEATLYADDGAAEIVKEFKKRTTLVFLKQSFPTNPCLGTRITLNGKTI